MIITIFLFLIVPNRASGTLELTFLNVGQGDAILIRPNAAVLEPLADELNFWERTLDLAILTHPDSDHVAGFVELLKRYKIRKFLLTGVQHESEWYAEILRAIDEQKIPIIVANASTDFNFGGRAQLDIFWPTKFLADNFVADANAASIAGKLIFGETSAILTGDLDIDSEKIILKNEIDLHAQILKLGHHGSKTSSSAEFLEAVNPEFAIVSASADNSFGHPNEEVLARLENVEILETAKIGSIKFVSDGETWQLEN